MKNIFRFLGVLTLIFAFIGQGVAQTKINGQVRYAFELKQMTQAEADAAQSQGYVDLWTYVCFDEAFVGTESYKIKVTDGKISSFPYTINAPTHSFKIIDKNGNDDKTGNIAWFARPTSSFCSRPNTATQVDAQNANEDKTITNWWIALCPTWAYGASPMSGSSSISNRNVEYQTTIIEAEGKTWYAAKLYLVRFEYKQAQSFYVTFYKNRQAADGYVSTGSTTLSIMESGGDYVLWPEWTSSADAYDWYFGSNQYENFKYAGFIRGGVEIMADPEFSLASTLACSGSDVMGSFNVANWNGKSWSDFKAGTLTVSVKNTDGSSSKNLAIGTDLAFTAANLSTTLGTSSSEQNFPYSLSPAAYTLSDGSVADSLIWAFEERKTTLI